MREPGLRAELIWRVDCLCLSAMEESACPLAVFIYLERRLCPILVAMVRAWSVRKALSVLTAACDHKRWMSR